jgi:arginyl-tRNA synthetase
VPAQIDAVAGLRGALSELAGFAVELERPSDPAHGDYATNAALRLAGAARRPPREVAADLAAEVAALAGVARAEVAGPGFVNIFLDDGWFADTLRGMLTAGTSFGAGAATPAERIQVEMVSANPTGPITVAAARNGAYGDSVARLLDFAGHEVEREYYYNDAGAQMDRFRASVEAARRGEPPPEDGYQGTYVTALAALPGDPVPRMLEQIEETLDRFRVHFDSFERQSEVEAEIEEAIAELDTYEEDGAVWARTSRYGDEKDRVLVRSDGEPTYFAADAAYIRRKFAKGFDRLVYVLGADHHGYVARLRALAEMLGHPTGTVEVLIYQLVHLTHRGQATKMSKRRGDVVFLDEFMDEIGVDAARWYLVSRGHDQAIEIDVDLAAEKSQKNPVYYVQYAHARIAGIRRNAGEAAVGAERDSPLAPEERDLLKRLAEFPQVAAEAAARRGPHAVPTYAIRVADDFHRFYHHHKVLGSDSEAFRLGLCTATQAVVARCLDLIGVEAPDRM